MCVGWEGQELSMYIKDVKLCDKCSVRNQQTSMCVWKYTCFNTQEKICENVLTNIFKSKCQIGPEYKKGSLKAQIMFQKLECITFTHIT